ncbi:MAG: LuxR C-terminal-related transcriptional regulator [Leptolyngbyaceae cyanobacterium]
MTSSFNSQPFGNESVVSALLQTALDSLVDGLLIVAASGRVLQANTMAVQVCQTLVSTDTPKSQITQMPEVLWSLCCPVFRNIASGIETHLGLEIDITDPQHQSIRVRIQPLDLKVHQENCLMLILEDRRQAYRRRAIADGRRYSLTPREMDVWELRLQETPYETIAQTLFITENTVKKHVKNILAKRRLHDDGCGAIAS